MKKELVFNKENETLNGLFLLKPEIHEDKRGIFFESWNQLKFNNLINEKIEFVQDNLSFSHKNVLRGLHYQIDPFAQGKLVRCSQGEIFDVAVDIRKTSSTFGQWAGIILNSRNHYQLWIPSGFAHGFLVLSDYASVNYKTTNFYSKEHEYSVRWNDPNISIDWPLQKDKVTLSEKDKEAIFLNKILPENLF